MSESLPKCTWIVRTEYKNKKFRNSLCGRPATDVSWLDDPRQPLCEIHSAIEHSRCLRAFFDAFAAALDKRFATANCSRCGAVLERDERTADLCGNCFLHLAYEEVTSTDE
jgi:hypothetical protein